MGRVYHELSHVNPDKSVVAPGTPVMYVLKLSAGKQLSGEACVRPPTIHPQ